MMRSSQRDFETRRKEEGVRSQARQSIKNINAERRRSSVSPKLRSRSFSPKADVTSLPNTSKRRTCECGKLIVHNKPDLSKSESTRSTPFERLYRNALQKEENFRKTVVRIREEEAMDATYSPETNNTRRRKRLASMIPDNSDAMTTTSDSSKSTIKSSMSSPSTLRGMRRDSRAEKVRKSFLDGFVCVDCMEKETGRSTLIVQQQEPKDLNRSIRTSVSTPHLIRGRARGGSGGGRSVSRSMTRSRSGSRSRSRSTSNPFPENIFSYNTGDFSLYSDQMGGEEMGMDKEEEGGTTISSAFSSQKKTVTIVKPTVCPCGEINFDGDNVELVQDTMKNPLEVRLCEACIDKITDELSAMDDAKKGEIYADILRRHNSKNDGGYDDIDDTTNETDLVNGNKAADFASLSFDASTVATLDETMMVETSGDTYDNGEEEINKVKAINKNDKTKVSKLGSSYQEIESSNIGIKDQNIKEESRDNQNERDFVVDTFDDIDQLEQECVYNRNETEEKPGRNKEGTSQSIFREDKNLNEKDERDGENEVRTIPSAASSLGERDAVLDGDLSDLEHDEVKGGERGEEPLDEENDTFIEDEIGYVSDSSLFGDGDDDDDDDDDGDVIDDACDGGAETIESVGGRYDVGGNVPDDLQDIEEVGDVVKKIEDASGVQTKMPGDAKNFKRESLNIDTLRSAQEPEVEDQEDSEIPNSSELSSSERVLEGSFPELPNIDSSESGILKPPPSPSSRPESNGIFTKEAHTLESKISKTETESASETSPPPSPSNYVSSQIVPQPPSPSTSSEKSVSGNSTKPAISQSASREYSSPVPSPQISPSPSGSSTFSSNSRKPKISIIVEARVGEDGPDPESILADEAVQNAVREMAIAAGAHISRSNSNTIETFSPPGLTKGAGEKGLGLILTSSNEMCESTLVDKTTMTEMRDDEFLLDSAHNEQLDGVKIKQEHKVGNDESDSNDNKKRHKKTESWNLLAWVDKCDSICENMCGSEAVDSTDTPKNNRSKKGKSQEQQ